MGFSAEVKDFLGGFTSGFKMADDAELSAAKAQYYRSLSEGSDDESNLWGYAPDDEPDNRNVFQRLFSSNEAAPEGGVPDEDPYERSSRRMLTAFDNAMKNNDPWTAEKISKGMEKYELLLPRNRKAKFAEGGAVPELEEQPEPAPAAYDPSDLIERISDEAAPGIELGLRSMEEKLRSAGGAVSDGSEAAASFAKNEGAITPEEYQAMMKVIDPQGKLPPEARLAAAIRSVTNFYVGKDQPEKAAELANKLLLFSKQSSQTRGALAVQAMQNGDTKNAAKILADGNNFDLPFAELIKPAVAQSGDVMVNADGSVPVQIVRGGKVQDEINATPDMIMKVAQQTATGQTWTQRLMQANAELRARREAQANAKSGKNSIEGHTDLIDDEIGRVMGRPNEREGMALPDDKEVPLPPRRPDEFKSPDQKITEMVGVPAMPEQPMKFPAIPDDTAPRTKRPFDVVDGSVNDEYADPMPEAPTKPDYQVLPKFRAELLSPEALRRFEKMSPGQRSSFIREWNSRSAASYDQKKALDKQYAEDVKAYREKEKEARKNNGPRSFDPDKADAYAESVEKGLIANIGEENFKKLPAGQRATMRDIAMDIVARNRNVASGSVADTILSLTAINEKNPDEAGFTVVRDKKTQTFAARFPDGRTVKLSPDALQRLAALRAERRTQFDKVQKDREDEKNKPSLVDLGKKAVGETLGYTAGLKPLQPKDSYTDLGGGQPETNEVKAAKAEMERARARNSPQEYRRAIDDLEAKTSGRFRDSAVPPSGYKARQRNEAIDDLTSNPEVKELMRIMQEAAQKRDRKTYQAAAQKLRSLTNNRYGEAAIPNSGY